MGLVLDTPEGATLHARRKALVEPVNGQVEHARRVRQFSVRGLAAVESERTQISLGHDMLELFGQRSSSGATT